jgi:hypothetical protein
MNDDVPHRDPLRVRPYALTGGRVRSSTELPLETIVRLSSRVEVSIDSMTVERREICTLSAESMSIAELSAHLRIPLGVVRVIVGDMVTEGILDCHRSDTADQEGRPDLRLLERVLDGIQAL